MALPPKWRSDLEVKIIQRTESYKHTGVNRGAVSKYKVNPFTCKKFIADIKYFDRMTIKVNVIQSPRLFKEALPQRVLFPNLKYIY